MKRWIAGLVSISAVAGVTALVLVMAGAFDGDSTDGDADGSEIAAVCAEDNPDCEDTIVVTDDIGDNNDGDGATSAPVCAPGFPDCIDTIVQDDGAGDVDEELDGATSAPVCAPGFPDCVDTIVQDDGAGAVGEGQDGVSIAPVCAPGFPDCIDMIVGTDDDTADEPTLDPISPVTGACAGDAFAQCEEQATNAVLADAGRVFGVDASEIDVESAAFQEWSDSCLNAAGEGELCAQVITPGFVVVLSIGDSVYEYHTDLQGNVRLAA